MEDIGLKRGIVMLKPHNKNWERLFKKEAEKIKEILQDFILDIQHVGSTAIPGIVAKPIIDISIALDTLENIKEVVILMEEGGYVYRGEMGIPDRHLFIKGDENYRTHHIHVMTKDSFEWEKHILFRDYLIQHSDLAQEYEKLKQDLELEFKTDRGNYTEGKTEFIQRIVQTALKEKKKN